METVAAKTRPGQPVDSKALIAAMKDALGDVLDDTTMKALEVSAVMESAGASKEEIEEMMTMIMNKGGGISQDFVENIKKAMAMGAGRTPEQTMEMLKDAMEEEMNSVTTCLRNTFLNRLEKIQITSSKFLSIKSQAAPISSLIKSKFLRGF